MSLDNLPVKIIGISGSPRKGSTQYCVQEALKTAGEIAKVSTEFIDLRGKTINFCIHCNRCVKNGFQYCPAFDDDMNDFYPIMMEGDGFIVGSPVYQMTVSGQLQAFFNRLRPIAPLIQKGHWASRVGGAIAVGGTRHGGQETTLETILNFFFCTGMVAVSGGIYAYNGGAIWSQDKKEEGAKEDLVGMETVRVVARRVVFTAKMMKYGAEYLSTFYDPARFTGTEITESFAERRKRLQEDSR